MPSLLEPTPTSQPNVLLLICVSSGRRAQGAQELNFREARKEFGFDAPPSGAVTPCLSGEDISVLSPAKRSEAAARGTRSTGK